MRLYTVSVSSRRRAAVTMPHRAGRPAAVVVPGRGPIAVTCRCGADRARHEHLRPGRDCARCTAHPAR